MKNSSYVRAAIAQAALEHTPRRIRQTLLREPGFRQQYSLRGDATIAFKSEDLSIQRSVLFNAIREAYVDGRSRVVVDTDGRDWELSSRLNDDSLPEFEISSGDTTLPLHAYYGLAGDPDVRVRSLELSVAERGLPAEFTERWKAVLSVRELDDQELGDFQGDLQLCAVVSADSILRGFVNGQLDVITLVPSSATYFERLVGSYDHSLNVAQYAQGGAESVGSSHKCMHDLASGRSATAVGRRCGCARARYAAVQSSVAQSTAACADPSPGGGLLGGSLTRRKLLIRCRLRGDEP